MTPLFTIQPAALSHRSGIYDLVKQSLGYQELDYDEAMSRYALIMDESTFRGYVAIQSDSVIGFIGGRRILSFNIERPVMEVIVLAVAPEYQGKGIGTALLEQVETYAQADGIGMITLNSGKARVRAHEFYQKQKYELKGYNFKKKL